MCRPARDDLDAGMDIPAQLPPGDGLCCNGRSFSLGMVAASSTTPHHWRALQRHQRLVDSLQLHHTGGWVITTGSAEEKSESI